MTRAIPRNIEDFEAVFRAISKIGDPVVLVGGHAVNLWALSYKENLREILPRYEPLMSGDLDLFATADALRKLHAELGGRMYVSPPREITQGLLVLGVEPETLEVDVLRSVKGIPNPTVHDVVELDVCDHRVSVPFPHILLQAKLANALQISQEGRQDVKHAKVASLVTGAFLLEAVSTATEANARDVLCMLQAAMRVVLSPEAQQFANRYGHECLSDIPIGAIATSPLPKIVTFCQMQLPRLLGAYRKSMQPAAALPSKPEPTAEIRPKGIRM